MDEGGAQHGINENYKLGDGDKIRKAVTVKVADLRWFMSNLEVQFLGFCACICDASSDKLFGTEFVTLVINEFWDEYYKKMLYLGFIPYIIGLISYLLLIHEAFEQHEFDPDEEQSSTLFKKFVSLFFIGYQIFFEYL